MWAISEPMTHVAEFAAVEYTNQFVLDFWNVYRKVNELASSNWLNE